MSFRVTIITLFPGFFLGPLQASVLGKAVSRGDVCVTFIDPRDFTEDRHRTVDDTPYGGGPGMLLKPEPLVRAIEKARRENPDIPVFALTPSGQILNPERAEMLARGSGMTLVCGRYEGFDERIMAYVDGEYCIGDYVLSGGEPAAVVLLDSVSRFLPEVLGNSESTCRESFSEGMLEYPQYTRPASFRGADVPDVLLSGDHQKIAEWRRTEALRRTKSRRPDLFEQLVLSDRERAVFEDERPQKQ